MQGSCSDFLCNKLNFWCRRKTSVFMSFPIWLSLSHNPYYVYLSSVRNCIFLKGVELETIKSSANTVQKFILETGLEFFFVKTTSSARVFQTWRCIFFHCLYNTMSVLMGKIFKVELIQFFLSFIFLCLCQKGWGVPLFVTGLFFFLGM